MCILMGFQNTCSCSTCPCKEDEVRTGGEVVIYKSGRTLPRLHSCQPPTILSATRAEIQEICSLGCIIYRILLWPESKGSTEYEIDFLTTHFINLNSEKQADKQTNNKNLRIHRQISHKPYGGESTTRRSCVLMDCAISQLMTREDISL